MSHLAGRISYPSWTGCNSVRYGWRVIPFLVETNATILNRMHAEASERRRSEQPEDLSMPLTIPDEELAAAGLSEARLEFEAALLERNLPLIRVDESYWRQELESMKRLGWS